MRDIPTYLLADVEIRDPDALFSRIAAALDTRILAKPFPTTEPILGFLADGQHRVDALRETLSHFDRKHDILFSADTPRGLWSLIRLKDPLVGALRDHPIDLRSDFIISTPGRPGRTTFSIHGPVKSVEDFTRFMFKLFGDKASVASHPLMCPPVDRIVLADLCAPDERDLAIVERCILDGYFETTR